MIPIVPIAAAVAISMLRPRSSNPELPKIGMAASLLWVFGSMWLLGHANRAVECSSGMPGRDCWIMTAPWSFLLDGAAILLLFPWLIARTVTIPLGLVRSSWVLGRLASVRFSSDRRGGAALAAAWALLRSKQSDSMLATWVERQIAACVPLRGAAVAAAGLARAAAGNRAAARTLLASVELLDPLVSPREARKVAREWLVVDAVAEGEWRRAADIGEPLAPLPRTFTTMFLAAVASRLATPAPGGAQPVSRPDLVRRWLLARQRRAGWRLLQQALEATPALAERSPVASATTPLGPPAGGTALQQALGWHAMLLAEPSGGLPAARLDELVRRLGRSWESALDDPVTRRHLAERSLALGVGGSDDALARTAEVVRDELAAWAAQHRRPLPENGGPLVERAAACVRDRLLGEIELDAQKLQGRIAERRSLPPLDEWREWLAMRDVAERVQEICGWSAQKLAFAQLHSPLCDAGVWLWNERRERAIANAMFRWLHNEALTAGDQPAIDLQRRNVQAGAT